MKRIIIVLLLTLSLSGCATQDDIDEAYEKGRSAGYNEGYDLGYDDGFSVGYKKGIITERETPEEIESPDFNARNAVDTAGYREFLDEWDSNSNTYTNPLNDMGIDDETFDIVVQHVKDNPYEYFLYSERDLELAYESGLEDAGW